MIEVRSMQGHHRHMPRVGIECTKHCHDDEFAIGLESREVQSGIGGRGPECHAFGCACRPWVSRHQHGLVDEVDGFELQRSTLPCGTVRYDLVVRSLSARARIELTPGTHRVQ